MIRRDYSLLSQNSREAVESGLSQADWYQSEISRKELKTFMQRSDQPAIRDTLILFFLMILSATGGIFFWGTANAIPFWLVYGVLYGSAMDSRWHECGHGTAFRTPWMNDWLYQVASFMMIRNPTRWRWSHSRHHTDTIIVGRDPEIVATRPVSLSKLLLSLIGISDLIQGFKQMLINATGKLCAEEATYIPEMERHKVAQVARIWLLIYLVTVLLAVVYVSWIPLMLIGLPRLYGAWHHVLTGLTQHAGLADNVIDHRLNSRTVYMNPISRFIYWNMNYHAEHHMFPTVPYHQLPKLHERLKEDMPAPSRSILGAYREFIPTLWRQRTDPETYQVRPLPVSAKPYKVAVNANTHTENLTRSV